MLSVHLQTQTPHRARRDLARILGLDISHIRVIAPDVGGAFGGKASLAPDEAMVAFAALKLGRPLRWNATRSEEFLAATRGRGAVSRGRLAVDAEGKFLAIEAEFAFPLGHWLPYSAAAPANNAARILPGPYRINAAYVASTAQAEARAAVNIYRGAGRPEAAMLLERLIDEAAAVLDMDSVRLRRRNLVKGSRRHVTVAGAAVDSMRPAHLLATLCARADYATLRRRQKTRRRKGEVTGIGVALYIEPCGQGWESGRVGIDPEGRIVAATGTSAQGQGRETAFAQIVADVLGVPPAAITLRHGDTALSPEGIGALASRSTAIGGSAMRLAAENFLALARDRAASLLNVPKGVIAVTGEGFWAGGNRVTWHELAGAAQEKHPDGLALAADAIFETAREAWASGAVLASVAIARETGELRIEKLVWVDDAGTIVNPLLVEGQLIGGMAQGFGEAVMERLAFSPAGELITGSFQDYALPRAADVPEVEIIKVATPSRANPLGVKGVGEAGCIGVPTAIVNAAVDALRPFGVTHLDMPLTSEKLWRLIRGAEGAETR
jgi:carbon-monoxide dehydrogenase large subunit